MKLSRSFSYIDIFLSHAIRLYIYVAVYGLTLDFLISFLGDFNDAGFNILCSWPNVLS